MVVLLMSVRLMVTMIMAAMGMAMTMAAMGMAMTMMGVIKGHNPNEIDDQSDRTNYQQLSYPFQIRSFRESFHCLRNDLDAD